MIPHKLFLFISHFTLHESWQEHGESGRGVGEGWEASSEACKAVCVYVEYWGVATPLAGAWDQRWAGAVIKSKTLALLGFTTPPIPQLLALCWLQPLEIPAPSSELFNRTRQVNKEVDVFTLAPVCR